MRITTKTEISAYPLLSRGKVRDIYDIDDKTLLDRHNRPHVRLRCHHGTTHLQRA